MKSIFSDPGGEVLGAPIGSELWAKRVRLELQSVLDDLPKAPLCADRYFHLILEHRAWSLMNRRDGSKFETFDELCEAARPWGLGTPYKDIERYLVLVRKPIPQIVFRLLLAEGTPDDEVLAAFVKLRAEGARIRAEQATNPKPVDFAVDLCGYVLRVRATHECIRVEPVTIIGDDPFLNFTAREARWLAQLLVKAADEHERLAAPSTEA